MLGNLLDVESSMRGEEGHSSGQVKYEATGYSRTFPGFTLWLKNAICCQKRAGFSSRWHFWYTCGKWWFCLIVCFLFHLFFVIQFVWTFPFFLTCSCICDKTSNPFLILQLLVYMYRTLWIMIIFIMHLSRYRLLFNPPETRTCLPSYSKTSYVLG